MPRLYFFLKVEYMVNIVDLVFDTFTFGIWSGYKNQQKMDDEFQRYMMERK